MMHSRARARFPVTMLSCLCIQWLWFVLLGLLGMHLWSDLVHPLPLIIQLVIVTKS